MTQIMLIIGPYTLATGGSRQPNEKLSLFGTVQIRTRGKKPFFQGPLSWEDASLGLSANTTCPNVWSKIICSRRKGTNTQAWRVCLLTLAVHSLLPYYQNLFPLSFGCPARHYIYSLLSSYTWSCDKKVGAWVPDDIVSPATLPLLDHLLIPALLGQRLPSLSYSNSLLYFDGFFVTSAVYTH